MANINVLDSSVYNLISAGEVIERPASVVKELFENAIDSGADRISVSIKEGGIREIVVTDNGCGMDADNLKKAFLPHATSKLATAADLDNISTLGFRGEALASIAAVSKTEIISRLRGREDGAKVAADGGKISEVIPCGAAEGTTVKVSNLFFNTPVRARFLKKPAQEEKAITDKIAALILANPEISVTYIVDGKTVFGTSGGFENAVYTVYSTEVANNLIWFDETREDGYRVYGYTGTRDLTRHNRSLQTIIVNGRTVSDKTIETAATQAYGGTLMKRCYPVFVINLIVPFDDVDVNVHPAKNEVRFRQPNKVFSAVYRAIEKALATQARSMMLGQEGSDSDVPFDVAPKASAPSAPPLEPIKLPDAHQPVAEDEDKWRKALDRQRERVEQSSVFTHSIYKPQTKVAAPAAFVPPIERPEEESDAFREIDGMLRLGYNVVGQLFNTFLLIEQGDKAYLIDQHAVHERMLYDELIAKINAKKVISQPLLVPYILECDGVQSEFVAKHTAKLTELGFEIEPFGVDCYKVNAVPDILTDINLAAFFSKLFDERGKIDSYRSGDMITDALASRACKAAIKGGDKLTEAQITSLLDSMKDGVPLQCPHGRPTTYVFTRKDLDKLFKRIV